jgi:hypothetical protein
VGPLGVSASGEVEGGSALGASIGLTVSSCHYFLRGDLRTEPRLPEREPVLKMRDLKGISRDRPREYLDRSDGRYRCGFALHGSDPF